MHAEELDRRTCAVVVVVDNTGNRSETCPTAHIPNRIYRSVRMQYLLRRSNVVQLVALRLDREAAVRRSKWQTCDFRRDVWPCYGPAVYLNEFRQLIDLLPREFSP